MELYQKHGTNPFSSCLPILAQSPIFFALFRVLNELGRLARRDLPRAPSIGPLTQELAIAGERRDDLRRADLVVVPHRRAPRRRPRSSPSSSSS